MSWGAASIQLPADVDLDNTETSHGINDGDGSESDENIEIELTPQDKTVPIEAADKSPEAAGALKGADVVTGPWFHRLKGTDHITEAELLQLVLRYLDSRGYQGAVRALAPFGQLRRPCPEDPVVSLDALCWQVCKSR